MRNPSMEAAEDLYINIPGIGLKLYAEVLAVDEQAPNLIFCSTPVTNVTRFRLCYAPFFKMGFNVFAMNFTGLGKTAGRMRYFSLDSIVRDFDLLIDHIRKINSGPVFLFGGTGTGGILAQHYVAARSPVKAFAQYGVCLSGDPSPLKYSPRLLNLMHSFMSLIQHCTHFTVPLHPPDYCGFNAEKENAFYAQLTNEDPDMFKVDLSFVTVLLSMFLGENGHTEKEIRVPTLVYKTLHDRYYPAEYFDRYFASLTCPKRMVEINDVHNAYYFHPQKIAEEAAGWFRQFC